MLHRVRNHLAQKSDETSHSQIRHSDGHLDVQTLTQFQQKQEGY